ncbi:GNAT family protein [Acetivibrio clariflavus]|uniref:GNAT family N-acetyltransferase n=1 Tax=Acetivibrio clariflavus TaxID=288965 RepID=UPI0031F5D974
MGNGFATEMASKLIEICFKDIKLHKVSASCNVNNVQSRKGMEKVGKIKEGELRKVRFRNGVKVNEYKYGILYEEWESTLV